MYMYIHAHTFSKLFREGVREGGRGEEGGRKGREGKREIARR